MKLPNENDYQFQALIIYVTQIPEQKKGDDTNEKQI